MLLYMIIQLLSMNISYWWWVWMSLELLNWLIMIYIKNYNLMMQFMMWQSVASLGLILSLIFLKLYFMSLLFMLFKMSMPPFHYWYWSTGLNWPWNSLILFMFIHKYTPILIFLSIMLNNLWSWIVVFNFMSFLFFFSVLSMKSLVFAISLGDTSWMIFSGYFSFKILFTYFLLNLFIMFILLKLMKNINFIYNLSLLPFLMIIFLYMGLPPLVTFMLKIMILSSMKMMINIILLFCSLFNMFFLWHWILMCSLGMSFKIKQMMKVFYTCFFMNMLWLFIY